MSEDRTTKKAPPEWLANCPQEIYKPAGFETKPNPESRERFDESLAEKEWARLRREYELRQEDFITPGYVAHEAIMDLCRWQFNQLQAKLDEAQRELADPSFLSRKNVRDLRASLKKQSDEILRLTKDLAEANEKIARLVSHINDCQNIIGRWSGQGIIGEDMNKAWNINAAALNGSGGQPDYIDNLYSTRKELERVKGERDAWKLKAESEEAAYEDAFEGSMELMEKLTSLREANAALVSAAETAIEHLNSYAENHCYCEHDADGIVPEIICIHHEPVIKLSKVLAANKGKA